MAPYNSDAIIQGSMSCGYAASDHLFPVEIQLLYCSDRVADGQPTGRIKVNRDGNKVFYLHSCSRDRLQVPRFP